MLLLFTPRLFVICYEIYFGVAYFIVVHSCVILQFGVFFLDIDFGVIIYFGVFSSECTDRHSTLEDQFRFSICLCFCFGFGRPLTNCKQTFYFDRSILVSVLVPVSVDGRSVSVFVSVSVDP